MPRPQGHNHVCIITRRCNANNKIARPLIVCPGIDSLLLESLRVAGLLYCKKTIWGYFLEVWIGDRLYVRTENGVYYDESTTSTTPEWHFPGSWIIPGAPASTAVNHKFCLEIASYNEWVCSRCFGVMALLYLFVVRGDRMGRAKESKLHMGGTRNHFDSSRASPEIEGRCRNRGAPVKTASTTAGGTDLKNAQDKSLNHGRLDEGM